MSISCGENFTVCLKEDGTIKCFGNNKYNQLDPIYKSFTNIIKVSCGLDFTICLKEDATLECFGSNNIIKISCGRYFTVFLKEDENIKCFGNNYDNQLDQIYKSFDNIKIHYKEYILK